jgi:hypothetical protein
VTLSSGHAETRLIARSRRGSRSLRLYAVSKRLSLVLPLLATLTVAAPATPALAGPADIAATQKYLQANYALVRAGEKQIGPSEANVRSVLRSVSGECPGAAGGSPQGEGSDKLGDELQGAMTIAGLRTVARPVAAFVHAVAHLRWSNPTLTQTVSSYAGKLASLASLEPPQVCADVRAWTAGGFATLPASTTSFDLAFESADVALGEVPAELLAPYERPAERSTLHSTARLEAQLAEAENRAVQQWEQTLRTLGVTP